MCELNRKQYGIQKNECTCNVIALDTDTMSPDVLFFLIELKHNIISAWGSLRTADS